MKVIDRILVYCRGQSADDPAIARALDVARVADGRILLLDVFGDLPPEWAPLLSSLHIGDARQEAERERRGQLEGIGVLLHHRGVRVQSDLRWGRPVIEIVREAVRGRHDLVIMDDERAEGTEGPTREIVRECPAPVWVVKNAPHIPPPRVLAAVDPESETPSRLDREILALGESAARVLGAELYVVHAWQPLDETVAWLPDGFRVRAEKNRIIEEVQARHYAWLRRLISGELHDFPCDRVRMVEGDAADTVLEIADDIGADLIVLGTARSAENPGVFVGSTAQSILERTRISILAIKPEGFASPVV